VADFIDDENSKKCREVVDALLNVESGLTNWEMDFLDNLKGWVGNFTEKQARVVEKIYDRVLK